MDYEKRYKEALERARKIENGEPLDVPDGTHIPVAIFPELKENNADRTRKGIIKSIMDLSTDWLELHGVTKEDAITWLEKQGKQSSNILWHDVNEEPDEKREIFCEWKSSTGIWHSVVFYHAYAKTFCEGERIIKNVLKWTYVNEMLEKQGEHKSVDKVESKFKVGDWVVYCNEDVDLITGIKGNGYSINNGGYIPFVCASDIRLWTFQDAKDGDVLCTYECGEPKIVFILKGTPKPKKPCVLRFHCYYNLMYPYFEPDFEKGCLAPNEEDVKPATKEQRDTLFAKIKESGYEWNADKKELIKL